MNPRWVASSELKGPAEGTDNLAVRKTFSAAMEIPPDSDRTVRFRITTGAVDRERDTIDPKGWDVSDFLKSPVIMWAHDYRQPPIGRALSVEPDGAGLSALVEFAPPETYAFADTVFRLVKGGFLNATSVGFQPIEWSLNEERRGVDFKRQSLLEVSVCAIPANPEALIEARAAGLDVAPLREWAERIMNETADEPGIWMPRKQLIEHVLAKLDGLKSYSLPATSVSFSGDVSAIHEALSDPARIPYEDVRAELGLGDEHKAIPKDVSTELMTEGASWASPTLGDFTDKSWDQLTAGEKKAIAGHFAWARTLPPNNYADLKMPHHRGSDGKVVWRGVASAMAALFGARGGIAIPEEERKAVYKHLANHYRAFNKQPPEFREYSAKELFAMFPDDTVEWLPVDDPMTLSIEDDVFLELADDDPNRVEWVDRELQQVLSEVISGAIQEAAARDIGRQVREALTALTGRVD